MTVSLTGLSNKVAVVTGAGRMLSIGRALAMAFAEAGCDVVITGSGRSPDKYPEDERAAGWRDIESVAEEIRALGGRALPVVSNVSSETSVGQLRDEVLKAFGRVDFIINNAAAAAGPDRVPILDMPVDAWDEVYRVNVRGAFLMCQTFGRVLVDQGQGGAIVNISSVSGKSFPPRFGAYSSSKAALNALGAIMAAEVGPHQIRVNAVCAGLIETSRILHRSGGQEALKQTSERVPLRRTGVGSDVANMALYLCSDQGSWITGQSINVDGGMVTQH